MLLLMAGASDIFPPLCFNTYTSDALCLIPHIIAPTALHDPNVPPVDVEHHGLDGFAFKSTELANHVVEEMLTLRKTPPELGMERLE